MSGSELLEELGRAVAAVAIVSLIGLAAVIGLVAWFYKTRIKGFLGKAQAHSLVWLPPRLHLATDSEVAAVDRTAKRVEAFTSMGFQLLGRYLATNNHTVKLVALSNPDNGCCAIVYYVHGVGTWSDVMLRTQAGEWISASNVTKRLHFVHLPGDRKFHESNKTEAELIEIVLKARAREPVVAISAETFRCEYERAYAHTADQRLLEPLENFELRQLLRETFGTTCGDEPEEISDDELKKLREEFRVVVNRQLSSACVLDFMRQDTLPASEWQRSRDRLFVVHDRATLDEYVRAKSCEAYVTPTIKKHLKSSKTEPAREAFAKINNKLPARDRYMKLGSVSTPVAADIYRAPFDSAST